LGRKTRILKLAEKYIDTYGIEITPEELFVEFAQIVERHKAFERYLRESKVLYKLNKMKRNQRLKEKRKLFVQWYFHKNQDQLSKVLQIDLSEMVFVTPRTIREELLKETTA